MNVSIELDGRKEDVRIDSRQRIEECIKVLQKSKRLPKEKLPGYLISKLNQTQVSVYKTFAEEQIYDGDILYVQNEKRCEENDKVLEENEIKEGDK